MNRGLFAAEQKRPIMQEMVAELLERKHGEHEPKSRMSQPDQTFQSTERSYSALLLPPLCR